MSKRVFITGYSALTATGHSAQDTWKALLAGEHGLGELTQWDLSELPWKLGGEIKDLQPAKMLPDRKLAKVISRQDIMGIYAATQAVEHSRMIPWRDNLADATIFNEETGVFVGSPGNKFIQQYDFLPLLAQSKKDMRIFAQQLFDHVHPMWLLRILPNNVLAYTGITFGFKGYNHNVSNHAVSGTQALLEAKQAIQHGLAQRAVVVAYDVGPEPQGLYYYNKLGVISHQHLKPFDAKRDGTLLAEGAACVILESEDSAKARNATCYAELIAGKSKTECQGLFTLEKEGESLSLLLQATLDKEQLQPQDIGMIIAHGNGNVLSEDSEAIAIQNTFGNQIPPVTAFKWSMGHTLCVSGLLDTVLGCLALKNQCIPGIANLDKKASTCEHLDITSTTRPLQGAKTALIINRGFAAMNATVVIKACD